MFHLCDNPSCYPPHKHTPPFWSDSLNFDPVLEGMVTQTILLHSRQGMLVGVKGLGLSLFEVEAQFEHVLGLSPNQKASLSHFHLFYEDDCCCQTLLKSVMYASIMVSENSRRMCQPRFQETN